MQRFLPNRASRQAGLLAAIGATLSAVLLLVLYAVVGHALKPWIAVLSITFAAILAAATAGVLVELTVGRRLRALFSFLEAQAERPDDLRRLPPLGDDELGKAAQALNAVLANVTGVRVNMIDQGFELAATQDELELQGALAKKSLELQDRLQERAILFDLLRATTGSRRLGEVLDSLTQRLGPALRLREVAIFLRESEDAFVLRAAHGFEDSQAVMGRTLRRGEGVSTEVIGSAQPVVVRDVSSEPGYLAFWGTVAREGSFVAVPIRQGDRTSGILAMTRPTGVPFTDVELRFTTGIADTLSLAIRHAQLFEELHELSTHDELTGLANRRLLKSQLSMELERSRRFGHELSAVALDIDHFKALNDRRGHPAGDTVLCEVAQLLSDGVRRVDTVARVGGEEFLLLLPRADADTASRVANELRQQVEKRTMLGSMEEHITVSAGVTQVAAGDDEAEFLARADRALFEAKRAGRNRVSTL